MWTRRRPIFHSRVDINIERDEAEIRSYMTKVKKGSFAEKYSDLAKEWHPTKNGEMKPEMFLPHSDIKVWWLCPVCGHDYKTSFGHRVEGTGCPKCGILKSKRSKQKKVYMLDKDTLKIIKIFDSIMDASREMKINNSNISMVCKGIRKLAGGYGWKYVDE